MSAYVRDLAVNNWRDPLTFGALTVYRFGNWVYYQVRVPFIRQLLWICYLLMDTIILRLCCNSYIPARCRIGEGLRLPYGAIAIVINRYAIIGSRVVIGSGVKIIEPVKIGDGAVIIANSVVVADIPPLATAIGIPAVNIVLPNVLPLPNRNSREGGGRERL
jgi:serine O-acetyltransferase